jgi:Tfp pilus assembly protein PilV
VRQDGSILLDALVTLFVLSVGLLSAVYGLSVFVRSAERIARAAEAVILHENERTDVFFALPGVEEQLR